MTLSQRIAVVTGGGRGIGAATARTLAANGASVVVSARSVDEIEAVAEELREAGSQAIAIPCDVTSPEQILALRDRCTEAFGRPADILINNAGIADSRPLKAVTVDYWDHLFAVNVRSVMLCTQAFLPAMTEAGWGRIVNVASIAGKMGAAYIGAYSATKHAVIGFTRSIACEVATQGVTVNAVCPGYVDTDMTDKSVKRITAKTGITVEQAMQHLESTSPQHRLMTAEEVAFAVLGLCHELARGINGQSVIIDGGAVQA
ncbi:MAG: SDR family oxidoreductase [Thermoanaerobaculia bacterium]|nr:SDR family oxidoreductase [Thermoanaerobaculia bacterium]